MLYNFDMINLDNQEDLKMMKQEYSIVVFFDVLGFSNLVLNELKKAMIISAILSNINIQFNKIMQKNIESDESFTFESYRIFKGTSVPKMHATTFSDSIILSCPINDENKKIVIKEIITMMSEVQLSLLRGGFLIRGGITIEDICHNEKFVFGKGVVEAYGLESKKAIFPRIIFSDELIKLIEKDLNSLELPNAYEDFDLLMEDEKFYNQYIKKDLDQQNYIDYLGGSFIDFAKSLCPEYKNDFKKDFLDRIESLISEGKENKNKNVKEKYIWLEKKYLDKIDYLCNELHIL